MYIFIGLEVGLWSDADQPEADTWHIPWKINQLNKSVNKIVTQSVIWNNKIQPK